jgi:hypothetical protein
LIPGIYPNWWTWDGSKHPFIGNFISFVNFLYKKISYQYTYTYLFTSEGEGHRRKREVYIDQIGFGPTFEDADPWVNGPKVPKADEINTENFIDSSATPTGIVSDSSSTRDENSNQDIL